MATVPGADGLNIARPEPLAIIENIACAPLWGNAGAITFVGNTSHALYASILPPNAIATRRAFGNGRVGSGQEYLEKTTDYLDTLGFRDRSMHDMLRRVQTIAERKNDDPKEVV